ncbi:MAG TPA: hypothetical protein VF194_00795 [Ferrovibrio sp.]|uniref:hypothetical protein n=1 Tax=Ferrovibrio sp. TaxID=1917215 RepID=UPI002ED36258
MLPTPLTEPQNAGRQRAPAILYFDVPRVSPSVFTTLQDRGVLSVTRNVVVGDERTQLETELRQKFQVSEMPASPGRPGTPDAVSTTTVREGRLDPQALDDLQVLIDRLRHGDDGQSRLVPLLTDTLNRFGQTLGQEAKSALTGIIRRIETSVLGDGFDLFDFFRDPGLFFGIGTGLTEFSSRTNHQAADALGDVIRHIADGRLYDDNPHNDSLQALSSAINRLGRALDHESSAGPALQHFLDHIGGAPAGDVYARRIADVLDQTLAELRGGSLGLQAIEQLQRTIKTVQDLEDVQGNDDDRLRSETAEELQGLVDRYAAATSRSQTVVIPGQPAVPPLPGTREATLVEETTFVPSVKTAPKVVAVYQSVQESLKPLQKLSEPPPPVPNIAVLVAQPTEESDERNTRPDQTEGEGGGLPRFGLPYLGGIAAGDSRFGTPGLSLGQTSGQVFDSRI